MDTIVSKLVDVDREARLKMEEAQVYHDAVLRDLQQEKQKLQEEYKQKAALEIQGVRDAQSAALEESHQKIKEEYARLEEALNQTFDDNREEWIRLVTEKCLY